MTTAFCVKCGKDLPLADFRIWFWFGSLDRSDLCKKCEGRCVYQIELHVSKTRDWRRKKVHASPRVFKTHELAHENVGPYLDEVDPDKKCKDFAYRILAVPLIS